MGASGMKSGVGVGGEVGNPVYGWGYDIFNWVRGEGMKSTLRVGGVEFSGFSLTLVVISQGDTNHSTNLMIIGPKRIESITLSFYW